MPNFKTFEPGGRESRNDDFEERSVIARGGVCVCVGGATEEE